MQLVEKHVWCEVNIDAIIHNYKTILAKSKLPMYATVKADAYGHGAPYIAKVYQELDILGMSVSSFSEAMQIRKAGVTKPILILGYTDPTLAQELSLNNLTQTIFSLDYAKELNKFALYPIDCHLKIDTGMGRLGFDLVNDKEEALNQLYKVKDLQNIKCSGLFTHFASADMMGDFYKEYTQRQIDLFNFAKEKLLEKGFNLKFIHGQNSAGIARGLNNEFNVTRPGCVLYGYHPSDDVLMEGLIPALDLKSIVTHIKRVKKGQLFGYGLTFESDKDTTIATVCCGYADGFPRTLSGENHFVKINGVDYPVAGRICMDQFMVDLGDSKLVEVGDEVIVMGGTGTQSFFNTAMKMQTLPANFLTMLTKRAPKVYIKDEQCVHIEYSI